DDTIVDCFADAVGKELFRDVGLRGVADRARLRGLHDATMLGCERGEAAGDALAIWAALIERRRKRANGQYRIAGEHDFPNLDDVSADVDDHIRLFHERSGIEADVHRVSRWKIEECARLLDDRNGVTMGELH